MRKRTRGIIIPPETRTGVKRLSQEQKGCLLDAIYSYNIDGEIIEMDTSVGIVFDMMKDFFDINIENYDKISEQNAEKMRNRWGKIQNDTTVYNGIQQNTTEYKSIQDYTTATNKEKKRKENINKEKEIKTDTDIPKGIGEQALIVQKGNDDINELLEMIKGQVEFLGFIYKKGKYERERAKNILTGKEFGEICDKANMSRIEFCKNIINTSTLLAFWNGKINNAETLYRHYAQVYNSAVNKKQELETQQPKRGVF